MKAKIFINTTQYDAHGKLDSIDFEVLGIVYVKESGIYITYKETLEDKECSTTIKVKDGEVSVKKFGNINSNMVYKLNNNHISRYTTPYGIFNMNIITNYLSIDVIGNDGIKIQIDYNLNVENLFEGRNKINIEVKYQNK